MSELERRLLWLVAIRLLVAATIAGTYFLAVLGTADPWTEPARALVATVSLLTLLYLTLGRVLRGRFAVGQAYLQFLGDLVLITQFIAAIGPSGRRFSILYLVVIGVAAVMLRRSAGMVIAGLAFLCFSVPLLGQQLEIPFLSRADGFKLSTLELVYELGVHLAGFFGIAFSTSYLARDVTRAERALRQRDADLAELQGLYRDVVRSISSGLITTDLDGIVTSINRAGEEILGFRGVELVGRPIASAGLFSPEAWDQAAASERLALAQGSGAYLVRFEREIERGATAVPIGYSLTVLRGSDGNDQGFIVNFRDLTELRKLQDRVRMQDRMAAVGKMAAGLAHEVGNPLAAISGSAQMLSSRFEGAASQRKLLEIVLRESQRLDRTVKGFLQFARPRTRAPQRIDIVALLGEQIALLRNSAEVLPAHHLESDFHPASQTIDADPDQVTQVFWNLVRNGLKAMPDGGRLRVSGRIEGSGYAIAFRDTGCGMSEEERANLFHPFKSFFDEGVGIGMAIVYRIVQEHGGEIRVESELGKGSEVTVVLPLGPSRRQPEGET